MGEKSTDQFSDEEATRRMNEALRRALTSPPKPHSEMKIGKRKTKAIAMGESTQKGEGRKDKANVK